MANPIQNLLRAPELKQKLLFTLGCLAIYRLGAHITVPGVERRTRIQRGFLTQTLRRFEKRG